MYFDPRGSGSRAFLVGASGYSGCVGFRGSGFAASGCKFKLLSLVVQVLG